MKLILTKENAGRRKVFVVDAKWEGEPREFVERLRMAVAQWMNTQATGEMAFTRRLTFEDLEAMIPDCWLRESTLGDALREHGIMYMNITVEEGFDMEGVEIDDVIYERSDD